MEKNPHFDAQLPPGFRFHPSDEELIIHYLRNKVTKSPLPASIIADIELYKFNPWELPKKSSFGDEEWYFFTPRDRKYPNGTRPNRMAASGYWKATGIDKPILSSCGSKVIGVKKALVFYIGRPPRGNKTEWVMQEYRVPELEVPWSNKREKSMRLDDWVLCRISQKTVTPGNMWEERNGAPATASRESVQFLPKMDKQYNNYVDQEASMQQRIPPKSSTAKTMPALPSNNPEIFIREYLNKESTIFPTFLFSPPQDEYNYPSIDSVNSCLSYEANNNKISYSRNTGMIANLGKRKLSFESGHDDEELVLRDQNIKLAAGIINTPGQSNNIKMSNPNVVNAMASYSTTTHMEKLDSNYKGEQMGPNMVYHDLYRLAFS